MAVTKPVKRRDPSSPNTALVIFLVFFSLTSVGLGVWGYYGYAGQDKLKQAAEKAVQEKKGEKVVQDYYRFLQLECRLALEPDKIEADDKTKLDEWRKMFLEDGFKAVTNEAEKDAIEKLIKKNRDLLGWDEGTGFKTTFWKKIEDPQKQIDDLRADLAAKAKELADANKLIGMSSFKEQNNVRTKLEAQIKANHDEALAKIMEKSKALTLALDDVKAAQKDKAEEVEKLNQILVGLQAANNKLEVERDKLKTLLEKNPAVVAAEVAAKTPMGKAHGLILDVSTGKPMWDLPRGKIVSVELKERRVVINLGYKDKVKPELTFNVFAPGLGSRAEGYMKGTIEVHKVLGPHTSEAVITSLFDGEGREISLNDVSRGFLQRVATNPMKDGDLIFNLTWGTHAVIAGPVNWTGVKRNNPADQMRQLDEFKAILERQGVTVDAYIDMNDGFIKGATTPMTRYMIKGVFLEPDLPDGKSSSDRVRAVNNSIVAEEEKAVAKGMFILSASNFAMVIGYRPPRSADDASVSGFEPRSPYSGSNYLESLRQKEKDKMPEKK